MSACQETSIPVQLLKFNDPHKTHNTRPIAAPATPAIRRFKFPSAAAEKGLLGVNVMLALGEAAAEDGMSDGILNGGGVGELIGNAEVVGGDNEAMVEVAVVIVDLTEALGGGDVETLTPFVDDPENRS